MEYISAGIIPYDKINNQVYFLLNKINGYNIWTYFGGHVEKQDNNNPKNTAIREAQEESFDLNKKIGYLPIPELSDKIFNNKFYLFRRLNKNNKFNYIYFIRINKKIWEKNNNNLDHYIFDNKNNFVLNHEVSEIRWFLYQDIFSLIKSKKLVSFLAGIFSQNKKQIRDLE